LRIHCYLREIRERMPCKPDGKKVSLSDIARASGVSGGVLSQIERGIYLPPDDRLAQLEHAYGAAIEDWYPPRTLLALEDDTDA
jgi:transcriptional regulator with XRE-family HTH domain